MTNNNMRIMYQNSLFNPVYFPASRQIGNVLSSHLTARILRRELSSAKNLYRREFKAHYGCVNAIEFCHRGGEFMASGGDDRRVLLWNVEKALSDIGSPRSLKGEHNSNVFCLAFDHDNQKIFSGGNDRQVIVHNIESGATIDVFMHEDAVYGLTADPNNTSVFASACDDGRILVYDIREPPSSDPFCLANYTSSMHAVAYNPVDPRLLASANAREGIGLWDIRKPRSCLLRYGSGLVQQSSMSVCINKMGDRLLALRRRLPPVLYDIKSPEPLCEFDHNGYYNSCTMKSCSFAGDQDQYVLSGSDDCNLYMWKIPDDLSKRQFVNNVHMVLSGHRSIVNQVRFNAANHLIISSGVEKSIKVWSPFPIPKSEGGIDAQSVTQNVSRPVYSHEDYINLVLQSGTMMTHDYSNQSTEEDPRMLAFFDSLVQRELAGFSSSDELSTSEEELFNRIQNLSGSDLSDTESNHSHNESQDIDGQENPFTVAFATADTRSMEENHAAVSSNTSGHYSDISDSSVSDPSSDSDSNDNVGSKTIAQLIKEKRQHIKSKGKRRNKRPLVTYSSDSSDSEVEKKSSSSGSDDNMEKVQWRSKNIQSLYQQRNKSNPKLKKIKHLKENLMKSDSDLDEPVCPEEKRLNGKCDCSIENSLQDGHNKCTKSNDGEMGPYLHEAVENQPCCSKSMVPNGTEIPVNDTTENKNSIEIDNGNNNGQASWMEFKRFKKNSKSRKYRSHSKEDD